MKTMNFIISCGALIFVLLGLDLTSATGGPHDEGCAGLPETKDGCMAPFKCFIDDPRSGNGKPDKGSIEWKTAADTPGLCLCGAPKNLYDKTKDPPCVEPATGPGPITVPTTAGPTSGPTTGPPTTPKTGSSGSPTPNSSSIQVMVGLIVAVMVADLYLR